MGTREKLEAEIVDILEQWMEDYQTSLNYNDFQPLVKNLVDRICITLNLNDE